MGEQKYRAQILLEPEQHKTLAALAEQRGRSVSAVVREIVADYLTQSEQAQQQALEAIEQVRLHRAEMLAKRGGHPIEVDLTVMIEEMRTERTQELFDDAADRR